MTIIYPNKFSKQEEFLNRYDLSKKYNLCLQNVGSIIRKSRKKCSDWTLYSNLDNNGNILKKSRKITNYSHPFKGKTYEEIYGKENALKKCKEKSIKLLGTKGRKHKKETKIIMSEKAKLREQRKGGKQMNNITISSNGIKFIQYFEGCKLTSYQDEGGIWTIGTGHVDSSIVEGMTITQQQADDFLQSDLLETIKKVNNLVTVSLNQNQADAIISFTFNEGSGRLQSSTLLKILNNGYFAGVPSQFLRWDIADGQISKGLLHRRRCESALFQGIDWTTVSE